eukprot:scaffold4136_cov101-Isochrysis_galbana.AAC.11
MIHGATVGVKTTGCEYRVHGVKAEHRQACRTILELDAPPDELKQSQTARTSSPSSTSPGLAEGREGRFDSRDTPPSAAGANPVAAPRARGAVAGAAPCDTAGGVAPGPTPSLLAVPTGGSESAVISAAPVTPLRVASSGRRASLPPCAPPCAPLSAAMAAASRSANSAFLPVTDRPICLSRARNTCTVALRCRPAPAAPPPAPAHAASPRPDAPTTPGLLPPAPTDLASIMSSSSRRCASLNSIASTIWNSSFGVGSSSSSVLTGSTCSCSGVNASTWLGAVWAKKPAPEVVPSPASSPPAAALTSPAPASATTSSGGAQPCRKRPNSRERTVPLFWTKKAVTSRSSARPARELAASARLGFAGVGVMR